MKLRVNPFLVNGLLITLAISFSTALFLAQIKHEALQMAKTEQEQAISTFWRLLRAKGSDFRIADGRLMAGNYVLNENYELPDTIREIFGGTATIFMGDTRVSTNVLMADGSRAVGTKLSGPAYDAIFRENRPYRGEAPILGHPYFTAYDPIRDQSGRTIGVLYVGVKTEEFLAPYERLKQNMIFGAAAFQLLFVALAFVVFSERSRREEALRETNLRLEAILHASPIAITALDRDLKVTTWNHAAESLFGWTTAEILGHPYPLVPPGRREEFRKLLETVMAGRTITDEAVLRQKKDGSPVELRISVAPLRDKDGVNGFMGVLVDVTSLKELEATLQEQLGFLQTLIDTIPSPIFYKDREGRYLGCNQAFERYLGLPKDRLVGKTVYDIAPKDLADRYFEMDEALFVNPGVQVYESSILYADGIRHDVIFNKATFTHKDDAVAGLVGVILDVTERKKAEDLLAEREEFLSNILDSIQDGISIIDEDLRIIRVNPVIERRFSDRMPIVGRKCHEGYHGLREPCESCPTLETLRNGKPSLKIFSRMENETEFWLELHTFPLFDSKKSRITGVIEYTRDVTERKRAEESLAAAEKKYRSLVEQSLVGTYIIRDGKFTYVNPKLAEIFGYTQEEITSGMTPFDLTVADDRARVIENIRKRSAGEVQSIHYLFQGLRKDGAAIHAEVYGTRIESGGKPVIIGTLLDVTERKRAEAALRESEERFHQVFAQNGDAIVLFRLDSFAIIDANQAAEELTGYSREELQELTPVSFIDPADFSRLIAAMPTDDCSRAFQLDKATGTRKDGRAMSVAIRTKMLRLRDEYVIHCSVRDITEKVRLEEEIRTTQAKLIHTNKMTSLGMLASSIAHEINNPNNYIAVNASMLADAWRDAAPVLRRQREEHGDFPVGGLPSSEMEGLAPRLFTGIAEGSRRINAIITNMKDYVRTDDRSLVVEFDLNKTVQDAAAILWHHIQRYTDNFRLALADDLPPARGNRQQIEQVVINLIMNALQALPDKKSAVSATTAFDREAGVVTVTVRDEGMGMGQKVLEHLTEPFFSTKIDEGGTGLGLYISASIIKEHKGFLEFDSKPGRGTTVTVRLPAA